MLLPLELLEHEAAEDHVEEDGGEDDAGAPPAPIAVHQPLANQRAVLRSRDLY